MLSILGDWFMIDKDLVNLNTACCNKTERIHIVKAIINQGHSVSLDNCQNKSAIIWLRNNKARLSSFHVIVRVTELPNTLLYHINLKHVTTLSIHDLNTSCALQNTDAIKRILCLRLTYFLDLCISLKELNWFTTDYNLLNVDFLGNSIAKLTSISWNHTSKIVKDQNHCLYNMGKLSTQLTYLSISYKHSFVDANAESYLTSLVTKNPKLNHLTVISMIVTQDFVETLFTVCKDISTIYITDVMNVTANTITILPFVWTKLKVFKLKKLSSNDKLNSCKT
jgi:hypothetical protein